MTYTVKKCPECGINLKDLDREKHAFSHWNVSFGHLDRLSNEEAKKRYRAIMEEV